MKMTKKHTGIIYGLLLIAVCLAGSMAYTTRVTAEETAVTYTYENGTLTFRGTGAIEKQTDGEENPWRSYKDTATNLVIEVGITEIGDSAFSGFTKLQKISLPKGLKLLGDNCFEKCSSLTSVDIPRRVTTWRDYCFKDCTSLTSVSIGRGLQEDTVAVGENPFLGDKALESITVETGHPYLYVQDHALVCRSKYGWNTLVTYPEGLTDLSYCIPEGVDTVGDMAFAGNQSLQSLSMKSSVTRIEGRAFWNMTSLKEIRFSDNITSIDWNEYTSDGFVGALYGCENVEQIILPRHLRSLGGVAFGTCGKLKELVLPANLKEFNTGAVYGCSNLEKITALNKDMKITGENSDISIRTKLCGYAGSTLAQFADQYDYYFEEITTHSVLVDSYVLDRTDVFVDGSMVQKPDTIYMGNQVEIRCKDGKSCDAVRWNDTLIYLQNGTYTGMLSGDVSVDDCYEVQEIHSGEEFIAAVKQDTDHRVLKLVSDIAITDWDENGTEAVTDFAGALDGAGHKIYLRQFRTITASAREKDPRYLSTFGNNRGIIKNIVFSVDYRQEEGNVEMPLAIICGNNYGVISDCQVTGTCLYTNGSDDSCIYGLTKCNYYMLWNDSLSAWLSAGSKKLGTVCGITGRNTFLGSLVNVNMTGTLIARTVYGVGQENGGDYCGDGISSGKDVEIARCGVAGSLYGQKVTEFFGQNTSDTDFSQEEITFSGQKNPEATLPEPSPEETLPPEVTETILPEVFISPTPTESKKPETSASSEVSTSPTPTESEKPKTSASPTVPSQTNISNVSNQVTNNQVQIQNVTTNYIQLTWKAQGDCEYHIYRSKKKAGVYQCVKIVKGGGTYKDHQAKRGQTYYYKIMAVNADGSHTSLDEIKPIKVTAAWLMKPVISAKKGVYDGRKGVQITLKKYQGKYAVIEGKWGGKYKKIPIRQGTIKSYKAKYRLAYGSQKGTISLRIRTWEKINGKKRYSAYSNVVRLKV
ncbi:fibronectin type III domain-containing protein [Jutongia sp.]|uniref:leucine-rich repeat domain-containing protein n=1 Tax=Jutongia sp. TaxID=2944204 RepID=UPI00307909A6